MIPSYELYSGNVLFSFLVIVVPFFLLFSSLSFLHFLSGEKAWAICGEIGGTLFAILFPLGLFFTFEKRFPLVSVLFLYSPLFPLLLNLLRFKYKTNVWWSLLLDEIALALLLPVFQWAPYSAIVTFAALLYLTLKELVSLFRLFGKKGDFFSLYTFKEVLDSLKEGILIAKPNGKILYLNEAFERLLEDFEIDSRERENVIFLELRWKSYRLVNEESFILLDRGHYLLAQQLHENQRLSLRLTPADNEVLLNQELAETNRRLQKDKTFLLATLDGMKGAAEHQEKEALRGLVHDSFAEEVSLIHQVLINPKLTDLTPLKTLMARGLTSYETRYEDLEEMERFYGLLGIRFIHEGDFALCPDKRNGLSLIQEATDNAIRHGNASEITIKSRLDSSFYLLEIANNGEKASTLTLHNGLSRFKKIFEQEGGELDVISSPVFAVRLTLPKG
jgi:PAS domain-containing protein